MGQGPLTGNARHLFPYPSRHNPPYPRAIAYSILDISTGGFLCSQGWSPVISAIHGMFTLTGDSTIYWFSYPGAIACMEYQSERPDTAIPIPQVTRYPCPISMVIPEYTAWDQWFSIYGYSRYRFHDHDVTTLTGSLVLHLLQYTGYLWDIFDHHHQPLGISPMNYYSTLQALDYRIPLDITVITRVYLQDCNTGIIPWNRSHTRG